MHHHNILYHSLLARNWVWGSLYQKNVFFCVDWGWGRWVRGCVYIPVPFSSCGSHSLSHPFLGLCMECVVWGDIIQHFSSCHWETMKALWIRPQLLQTASLGGLATEPRFKASKCFNSLFYFFILFYYLILFYNLSFSFLPPFPPPFFPPFLPSFLFPLSLLRSLVW